MSLSQVNAFTCHLKSSTPDSLSARLSGLDTLWQATQGSPEICIAIIDGRVATDHPCFAGAQLSALDNLPIDNTTDKTASAHGTHVASILFGQHTNSVYGIAPNCRGLLISGFVEHEDGQILPCSQLDLARAIALAVDAGAHIINISAGQLTASGEAEPYLSQAVQLCADNGVLIVAAAGNDGCECVHVPAAVASVLAVGAADATGHPLAFSNWGSAYQQQGILALGENILGAVPNGKTITRTGTSFATPIVTGIVALLLSLQHQRGNIPDPLAIRTLLLQSVIPCTSEHEADCQRFLAGQLNISNAHHRLVSNVRTSSTVSSHPFNTTTAFSDDFHAARSNVNMRGELSPMTDESAQTQPITDVAEPLPNPELVTPPTPVTLTQASSAELQVLPQEVTPSDCAGGCKSSSKPQMTYVLGQIAYDFRSETIRDSFIQQGVINPYDPAQILTHLETNPWAAESIVWTVQQEQTPIYALTASGAFAAETYLRIRTFLKEQVTGQSETASFPGYSGSGTQLMNGMTVPLLMVNLRGMYNWKITDLAKTALGESYKEAEKESLINFIHRVHYEMRNLGTAPQERALNFAVTNAFQAAQVLSDSIRNNHHLDTIEVERSPLCRPNSECWDVKLTVFNPEQRLNHARHVYRFTVDVSDIIPVTVGQVRDWAIF